MDRETCLDMIITISDLAQQVKQYLENTDPAYQRCHICRRTPSRKAKKKQKGFSHLSGKWGSELIFSKLHWSKLASGYGRLEESNDHIEDKDQEITLEHMRHEDSVFGPTDQPSAKTTGLSIEKEADVTKEDKVNFVKANESEIQETLPELEESGSQHSGQSTLQELSQTYADMVQTYPQSTESSSSAFSNYLKSLANKTQDTQQEMVDEDATESDVHNVKSKSHSVDSQEQSDTKKLQADLEQPDQPSASKGTASNILKSLASSKNCIISSITSPNDEPKNFSHPTADILKNILETLPTSRKRTVSAFEDVLPAKRLFGRNSFKKETNIGSHTPVQDDTAIQEPTSDPNNLTNQSAFKPPLSNAESSILSTPGGPYRYVPVPSIFGVEAMSKVFPFSELVRQSAQKQTNSSSNKTSECNLVTVFSDSFTNPFCDSRNKQFVDGSQKPYTDSFKEETRSSDLESSFLTHKPFSKSNPFADFTNNSSLSVTSTHASSVSPMISTQAPSYSMLSNDSVLHFDPIIPAKISVSSNHAISSNCEEVLTTENLNDVPSKINSFAHEIIASDLIPCSESETVQK